MLRLVPLLSLPLIALGACGDDDNDSHAVEPFTLRFAALVDGAAVGCDSTLTGFGPGGAFDIGIGDLRFYVSNLRFLDAAGEAVDLELDSNDFQYTAPAGSVALIDLTGNSVGSCAGTAGAGGEGTARTNAVITGKAHLHAVASIAFDVGVPQALMKATIADHTAEGAPSPLNEMYWNWNSGYRHFVFNFDVAGGGGAGGGFVHVGSRDCGPADGKALEDRPACTFVNTPHVALADFDPETDTVAVDLRALLAGVDFEAPIYDPDTFDVIGQGPGVECHSSPMQPDCATLFGHFGIDMDTGVADAAANGVFGVAP